MLGAIAGDVIGSIHEGGMPGTKGFTLLVPGSRFTDDSVMTVAVGHALRTGADYAEALRRWGRAYPDAGYGGWFRTWLARDDAGPYNSFGNGSAMRVSAVGWAFDGLDDVLREAAASAAVTHDHPEGIKGAQAVAAAVLLARTGAEKADVAALLGDRFGYDLSPTLEALRARGGFDVTCQGTVPAAAVAWLESDGFEDAVRNAVSLGGDADTLACITGAMAEAAHGGVPQPIATEVSSCLDDRLRDELAACVRSFGLPVPTRS